jgi:hypothetical protein
MKEKIQQMIDKVKNFKQFVNEQVENIEVPQYIKDDINKTGYEIIGVHPHGNLYILKLKQVINMAWDAKDFDRFSWVIDNGGMNRVNDTDKEFKLKVKF